MITGMMLMGIVVMFPTGLVWLAFTIGMTDKR